jgi:CheY-like chemotaxis protein
MMPGLNGIELSQQIRDQPDTGEVPILIITAAPQRLQEATLEAGATIVLEKPVNIPLLKATVHELLQR